MERELPFAPKIASNQEKTKNPITTTKALALTVTTTMLRKPDARMITLAVTLALTLATTAVIGALQNLYNSFFQPSPRKLLEPTHNQHILSGLKILITAQTSIRPSFRVYRIRT